MPLAAELHFRGQIQRSISNEFLSQAVGFDLTPSERTWERLLCRRTESVKTAVPGEMFKGRAKRDAARDVEGLPSQGPQGKPAQRGLLGEFHSRPNDDAKLVIDAP